MKNKLFIVILVCILLVLVGCDQQTKTPSGVVEQTTIPEETTQPTQEETTTEPTMPPVEGVEGTVLYNEDTFALVMTGLSETEKGGCMTVTAVNRTDMTVYMRLMNLSVNSFMFETLPTVELAPRETLETDYILPAQELSYNGIGDITDVQFNLWVYDSKDFKTPDVADGLCRYFPYGKDNVPTYERTAQETDRVLVDNDRFAVTVTAVEDGADIVLQLHLKNKSDKELLFIAPYATVDDVVIDPLWACNVSAGKQRNTQICFTAKQLKEAQLSDPAKIVLPIQIGDHQDWSAGAYFYESFTIDLPVETEEPAETIQ